MDEESRTKFSVPGYDHGLVSKPGQDGVKDQEQGGQWNKLFQRYLEKSSISGVPFITSSKYPAVRLIWLCLLSVASLAMTLHLTYLSMQYFSYEKQSKIDLEFENLKFPAVTICNANPFRASMIQFTSEEFQRLAKVFNPEALQRAVDEWEGGQDVVPISGDGISPESLASGPQAADSFLDSFSIDILLDAMESENVTSDISQQGAASGMPSDVSPPLPLGLPPPNDTRADNVTSVSFPPRVDAQEKTRSSPRRRRSDAKVDEAASEAFGDEFPDTWEAQSKPSSFDLIEKYFLSLYTSQTPEVRAMIGHQIEDMLIQCSFNGRRCSRRQFVMDTSAGFGNCFTIENDRFITKTSGPTSGLEMIFTLELDEYIRGISNSRGLQIVIHEPGTLPFPDDEGIAVGAGTNTFIGLKMMEIHRLGSPHGSCRSNDAFLKKYGVLYTRQICQKICLLEEIWRNCECFDSSTLMLNKLVNIPQNLEPCLSEKDMTCMKTTKHLFRKKSKECQCDNPCREHDFRKTLSFRQWPQPDFARVFISSICKENPYGDTCERLKAKSDDELKFEFVKVNIFYEDLNYERIEERPAYESTQFVSDIGGTIGLWIGLSLLSLFEILHLLIHIIITYCCPHWKQSLAKGRTHSINA